MSEAVRIHPGAMSVASDWRVPLIPRETLFGEPRRLNPALAGSGRLIGFVAPVDGIANVWVQTVGRDDARPVTTDAGRGVTNFCWSADGRYVLYLRDPDGSEQQHLHRIDVRSGIELDLTPIEGIQARFIAVSPAAPDRVLAGLNPRDRALHDAYEIDLRTGARRLMAVNPGLAGWVHDRHLRVRAGFRWTDDGGMEVVARPDDRRAWQTVFAAGPDDAPTTRVVAVTGDGRSLVVLSAAGAQTARLLRVAMSDGATDVLYTDPEYDVVGAGLHPVTGEPDIAVVHRERRHLEPLDPVAARRIAHLRESLRGDLMLLDRVGDDRWWLVLDYVTDGPSAYHLYDFETGQHRLLFTHQPDLARYVMAPTEPFHFTARDGLTVHGYLTFPPGRDRKRLPTVLAVHGGPWVRDGWGSGSEPQWLANRGYLCVQVNFRGSTGYGRDFASAGDGEWGGRMQDDLVDAVRWLTDREIADPDRLAIYGSSYGGYAALVGATFTPDLFRCAIAASAPTDLRTFVRAAMRSAPLMAPRLRRGVGDPDADGDFLWSRSPLSRASRARSPILIAHGANDPRVPLSEAEQFVAALRQRGTPHRFLVYPGEGHGLVAPRNRLAFFGEAERFLAEHLGGRHE